MRKSADVQFAGAFESGLDVDHMTAAIAAGLGGILDELLGVLHGVRDDLCSVCWLFWPIFWPTTPSVEGY